MRVLVSTHPAHGHLLPLLPFADAARRAGHDVVVSSGTEGAVEARRRGFTVWDVAPSRPEADAAMRAAIPDPATIAPEDRIATIFSTMFGTASALRAPHLVPRAEEWRPHLVVHTVTELAGAVAAARVGAVHAVHGLGPLPAETWGWIAPRFAHLCAAWDVAGLAEGILEVPYLDNCPPSLQPDAVAAFGNRRPLRPSAGDGDGRTDDRLPWDDATLAALPFPDTVHLTLGTIFHGATQVLSTALEGLRRLPVNVLVTVGPGVDPAILGPQPPHVLVTDFAPHALLLPHCTALVTQGGAGTIVAALAHGLPHLILPQGADQFRNGAEAERAGVARVLLPPDVTADAVADAVRHLLDDDATAAAARAVRAEIASMPGPAEVLAGLLPPSP